MNRHTYYILKDMKLVRATADEWAVWFERDPLERTIDRTELEGGVWVSTVCLGMDHGWGTGRPLLFETLVLNGELDGEMERYSTLEEAKAGHWRMVDRARIAGEAKESG